MSAKTVIKYGKCRIQFSFKIYIPVKEVITKDLRKIIEKTYDICLSLTGHVDRPLDIDQTDRKNQTNMMGSGKVQTFEK